MHEQVAKLIDDLGATYIPQIAIYLQHRGYCVEVFYATDGVIFLVTSQENVVLPIWYPRDGDFLVAVEEAE